MLPGVGVLAQPPKLPRPPGAPSTPKVEAFDKGAPAAGATADGFGSDRDREGVVENGAGRAAEGRALPLAAGRAQLSWGRETGPLLHHGGAPPPRDGWYLAHTSLMAELEMSAVGASCNAAAAHGAESERTKEPRGPQAWLHWLEAGAACLLGCAWGSQ